MHNWTLAPVNPLRTLTRWGSHIVAVAALACDKTESPEPPTPPPSVLPARSPSDPLDPDPLVCDGKWHGAYDTECRCRVLGPNQKSVDGWRRADVIQRLNEVSPAIVASNEGLYEALSLPSPHCGQTKVSWHFIATGPAKATQCRTGKGEPREGEDVSVGGELEVELYAGRRERVQGIASVPLQSLPYAREPGASKLGADPPISFTQRKGAPGGLKFMLHGERGWLEGTVEQGSARANLTSKAAPPISSH